MAYTRLHWHWYNMHGHVFFKLLKYYGYLACQAILNVNIQKCLSENTSIYLNHTTRYLKIYKWKNSPYYNNHILHILKSWFINLIKFNLFCYSFIVVLVLCTEQTYYKNCSAFTVILFMKIKTRNYVFLKSLQTAYSFWCGHSLLWFQFKEIPVFVVSPQLT